MRSKYINTDDLIPRPGSFFIHNFVKDAIFVFFRAVLNRLKIDSHEL